MISRMYVPAEGQANAASRAAALNAGLSVRQTADAPRYASIRASLPCVVLEYGSSLTILAEPTTLAAVDAAAVPLQAQEASDAQVAANAETVRTQAATSLAANKTFVAIASPTNAQNAAQIKALTRQMNGLIRLVLGQFDATD